MKKTAFDIIPFSCPTPRKYPRFSQRSQPAHPRHLACQLRPISVLDSVNRKHKRCVTSDRIPTRVGSQCENTLLPFPPFLSWYCRVNVLLPPHHTPPRRTPRPLHPRLSLQTPLHFPRHH